MFRITMKATVLVLVCLAVSSAVAGEGRIPVWQDPTVIVNSGKYIVTRDIVGLSGLAVIDVQAPHVDIDLNGFTLFAQAAPAGIQIVNQDNVTIRNGTIVTGQHGIDVNGTNNRKIVIEDVKVIDSEFYGIRILGMADVAIRRANVIGTGDAGIYVDSAGMTAVQGVIEDCQVELCGGGIQVVDGASMAILRNRVRDVTVSAAVVCPGGIIYDVSRGGLIAENTVESVTTGAGICLGDTSGCKIYNNVVREAQYDGIWLGGFSDDNLVLDNVVTQAGTDGLAVDGSRNHIERNVLNANGTSGTGHGLHFYLSVGGLQNTYGRNTARGNPGGPCTAPGPPFNTPDFCDDTVGLNDSFGDNYLPGPPMQ